MVRHCVNCNTFIIRSAIDDPQLCGQCEKLLEGISKERYILTDNT